MKKFIMALVCLMTMVLSVNAEKKVSEYSQSYFGKCFDIEASAVKNGSFTFFINCLSAEDNSTDRCGFTLESDRVEDFINTIKSVKEKFVEWEKTARDNNITDFDKHFDVKFKSVIGYFQYGKSYHFSKFTFKPYFKVTSTGSCVAVFKSGELTASDNRFIDYDGIYLTFTSASEFDDFINALDINKVLNKENVEKTKGSLFK